MSDNIEAIYEQINFAIERLSNRHQEAILTWAASIDDLPERDRQLGIMRGIDWGLVHLEGLRTLVKHQRGE